MINFSTKYNRTEFVRFLQNDFLPEADFLPEVNEVENLQTTKYIKTITKLGVCPSLRLAVYEARHSSMHDARVSLSKEIFQFMADKRERRALVLFVPENNDANYRFSLISIELDELEDGTIKRSYSNPRRYSYYLGEGIAARTPREYLLKKTRVQSVSDLKSRFSVEILNENFFKQYKAQYKRFCDFLQNDPEMQRSFIKYEDQGKAIRDYVKKMMGRIVFLYFVQRKGWLNGDYRYMSNLYTNSSDAIKADFLDKVLEPMFFGLLNTPASERVTNAKRHDWDLSLIPGWENIPYLNGGLFEQDDIDKCRSVFPQEYFKQLFEFFDTYNFTIDENDPDDNEVGIDPEMLGHIFENLLEDNKDKGAFYTPKEIVQYMCRQSVIQYLKSHEPDGQYASAIEHLINDGIVSPELQKRDVAVRFTQLLRGVKVCDPAIGSGAFPMGILYVLYHSIHNLHPHAEPHGDFNSTRTKREIIQNNIFGVDIEQGAVDIARLRFWLALVVDAHESEPLPNLDYKIMCGNSLLSRYSLEMPLDDVFVEYNKTHANNPMSLDKYKEKVQAFTNESNHEKKEELRTIIEEVKRTFRTLLIEEVRTAIQRIGKELSELTAPRLFGTLDAKQKKRIKELQKRYAEKQKELPEKQTSLNYQNAFEWRFEFPTLLDEQGRFMGFDIIIANPPFGAKLSEWEKATYKKEYADVHMRTPETFCYFISRAFRLAMPGAIVTYIVPNNMFFQNENENTRSLLLFSNQLIRAINLGDNTFENADVPTCIFIAQKRHVEDYYVKYSDYRNYNIKDIDWDKNIEQIAIDKIKSIPAYVLGISNNDIDILNTIRQNGITIDSLAEEMASGISTGGDKFFRISEEFAREKHFEQDILRKVLIGSDIDKYVVKDANQLIIYSTKSANTPTYPNIYQYLLPYQDKLSSKRETRKGTLPWWCLHWPRYDQLFEEPKIIMRQTSDSIRCVYDESGYYVLNSILVFKKNSERYSYKYIAAVLNSTLTDYLYKKLTQEEGRTFAEVKPANVRKLYIPKATREEQDLLSILYDYLVFLKNPNQTDSFVSLNSMFIDLFEKIIDGCVYELLFREHMKEREIDIMSYLYQQIKPIEGLSDQDKNNIIISVHSNIFMTDNPARARLKLFVSRSPEYLKPIIQH